MIKDLKNVIITFGLIALVLIQGSLFYQKKAKAESILVDKQSQLQSTKNSVLVKIAQDKALAQLLAKQQAQATTQMQMTQRPSRQSRAS